jgi:hypothetical protein
MLSTFLTITLQPSTQKFRDFLVDICALGNNRQISTFLTITPQTSAQKSRDFLVDICALGKQLSDFHIFNHNSATLCPQIQRFVC